MNRYTLIFTFLLSLVSLSVWSIDYKDLQERDGIIYKKKSGVPFTGAFTGENQGYVKNGKLEGEVILFNENGTILATSNYKNGNIIENSGTHKKEKKLATNFLSSLFIREITPIYSALILC